MELPASRLRDPGERRFATASGTPPGRSCRGYAGLTSTGPKECCGYARCLRRPGANPTFGRRKGDEDVLLAVHESVRILHQHKERQDEEQVS